MQLYAFKRSYKCQKVTDTKLHNTSHILYHPKDVSNPSKLDSYSYGSGILFYVRDNIPSNIVKLNQKFENFEGFFIEFELSKKSKWSLSYSYNPRKGNKNNIYLISVRA